MSPSGMKLEHKDKDRTLLGAWIETWENPKWISLGCSFHLHFAEWELGVVLFFYIFAKRGDAGAPQATCEHPLCAVRPLSWETGRTPRPASVRAQRTDSLGRRSKGPGGDLGSVPSPLLLFRVALALQASVPHK